MLQTLHFLLALVVIGALSLLVSSQPRKIQLRYLVQLLIIEIFLAWFLLHSANGLNVVQVFSGFFDLLMQYAAQGTDFVFGGMNAKGMAFFFLNVLCPIVFISALIGILQHFGILPIIIQVIGSIFVRINGMGKIESFNAVSSLILGQSENFIAYKNILADIAPQRMYTMAATAMSTVSMSIVGAYLQMLEPRFVVAALILNMFSTFIILSIINPYQVDQNESLQLTDSHANQSFFEMLGDYIIAGFKVAVIVAAMLIGFIALISAVNALFSHIFGYSFQQTLGYLFYPFARLIGVPDYEADRKSVV